MRIQNHTKIPTEFLLECYSLGRKLLITLGEKEEDISFAVRDSFFVGWGHDAEGVLFDNRRITRR